jgi:hypothetical protein
MPDAARHFRLQETALPEEEKLIRTAYVPTLLLVIAVSTIVFVILGTPNLLAKDQDHCLVLLTDLIDVRPL